MPKLLFVLFVTMFFTHSAYSQSAKVVTIGFYNLENLFDTVDDTLINDEDFLPEGSNHWTSDKYEEKLGNMAHAISQVGIETAPAGLSIIGVSEIENRKVLEELVSQPSIATRNYSIIHYDSQDRRGIDVALLYNPSHFTPDTSYTRHVVLYNEDAERSYTRDVLVVHGDLDGDKITVLVNHWPSRRGGEEASAPRRYKAAVENRIVIDSLLSIDPSSKILVMGDLNDDPTNKSLTGGLRAAYRKSDANTTGLYNPMYDLYRRGTGSNAYRDGWSLFDQVIVSNGLLSNDGGYYFYKANVFNKRFLIQQSGQYKGYPFRTFSGNTYQGGYSDHFPVYVYLVKEL